MPPPQQVAFLLDFDGTLVDIAPTPEAVAVAPGLIQTLVTLRDRCGGALAVVSGRPIAQIDHFLAGIPHAVAGEHGIAVRHAPGEPVHRAELPELPQGWLDEAERIVAAHPGARIERKHTGLVLHFRAVPEAGSALRDAAERLLAQDPRQLFHLQAAKMAWELKPSGIDKGTAVRQLMQQTPFAGRLPVFVGDDVTDEDGIRAAEALGGVGLRIPEDFATPAVFRDWLSELARSGAGTWGG
ncbi:trehalose-phosphatase [Lichenicola sp.]|uniref:trehalose-phosphatase n=1 Tax=Lichenicola sp. TaxID=2804529 RepID=UPI003AFFBAD4